MKTRSKFYELSSIMLNLLNLGLPAILVQEYLEISYSTFLKYLKNIKENGWEGTVNSFRDSIPKMLLILKDLSVIDESVDKKRLRFLINKILDIDNICIVLNYAGYHIQEMRRLRFNKDVPENYVYFVTNLIGDYGGIYKEPINGENLWRNFLNDFREDFHFSGNKWPAMAVDQILSDLSLSVRNDVKSIFTIELIGKVDQLLSLLTEREADVLRKYYGLGVEKLWIEKIAEYFGLTLNRVRQIREKAERRCRHKSRLHVLF